MRSFCLKTILAAGCLMAGAVFPAKAEVVTTVRIRVPFSFNVGNVNLPAGTYDIWKADDSAAVMVRAADGSKGAAAVTSPPFEGSGHQASFVRREGKYFLSGVSLGDGRRIEIAMPHVK